MAHRAKNPPAMQETRVQSLGWEDPLQKGMATHSNILAWRIPWTKEPGVIAYSFFPGKVPITGKEPVLAPFQ